MKKRKTMDANSDDESSSDNPSDMIYTNYNHLYFSGDITSKSSFSLCKHLRILANGLKIDAIDKNIEPEIYLHICWGKLAYIDDTYKNCIKIQEHINNFYLNKTQIGKKMLKDLLVKDLQFNAEECIKMGIVDKIYDGS